MKGDTQGGAHNRESQRTDGMHEHEKVVAKIHRQTPNANYMQGATYAESHLSKGAQPSSACVRSNLPEPSAWMLLLLLP